MNPSFRLRRAAVLVGALSGAALALTMVVSTGCVGVRPTEDASMPTDAGLTEGGIIREDAAWRLDASGPDASVALDAGADLCASAACDPRGEGGCLDGEQCMLTQSEPACSMAFGTLTSGMPCEASDACAPGLACFRAARTAGGVCSEVCCPGDLSACGTVARCGGDGVLVDGTATGWGRCVLSRTCDVLAPELTCEAREGCYVIDGAGTTECRLAGSAGAGAPCVLAEDCDAGLFCGGLGERTCLRICSLADPRTCTGAERCIAQTYSPAGTGICVNETAIRP